MDYGDASRLTKKPVPQGSQIDRGVNWQPTPLVEFEQAKSTPIKRSRWAYQYAKS